MWTKKGSWKIWLVCFLIFFLLLIIVGLVLYILFNGGNYDSVYEKKVSSGEIVNPVKNADTGEDLSMKEAVENFNENYIYYLLYSIKAYNLHDSLISSGKPRIEFNIGEETYNAIIDKGNITILRGSVDEKDIIIKTNKEEAVKMIKDKNYIQQSFQDGKSSVELLAGNVELASKGYLDIYTELTGKSITGFFISGF